MTTGAAIRRRGPSAQAGRLAASLARAPVDLRAMLDPGIGSQGPRPLCVPFAVSAGHEAARTPGNGPPQPLAPEAVWWHCTTQGQTSDRGMLLTDSGPAIADIGQPLLSTWPYDESLGVATQAPPPAAGPPPWRTAVLREIPVEHDGVEDGIEDALASGVPVVIIVEVTDEFYDPDDEGHVNVPNVRVAPGDYHAVICVGAATDPTYGRRLLIRNSWGDYWGVGGYCWLPVAYLVAFVAQAALIELEQPE